MNLAELKSLLERNRTYRRFDGTFAISRESLRTLVELTRYCASGRNLQPLRYRLVTAPAECAAVYDTLAWAGYYKDWSGPQPGERPTAYLVQCLDTRLTASCLCDDGLHIEAITLGATAMGLGCCVIKAFNVKVLSEALALPDYMQARYVVAVGRPVETVILDTTDGTRDASIVYYRDETGTHHVPKRPLDELIISGL